MKYLNHNSTKGSQWDVYKQLELIPESVSQPVERPNHFVSGLNSLWRPLLGVLIDELVEEQRVEYLDRCWSLNEFGKGEKSPSNSLQRFWVLIN
jgi:hypothetical protein